MSKRLNLGCGNYPIEGWVNVDLQPPADVIGDFTKMDFEDVDEVVMFHVLEHIPWVRTEQTLKLIHSWMKPNARITIEVPDMEVIQKRERFDNYWLLATYGVQSNPGEYHMAGFSRVSLCLALRDAGFRPQDWIHFESEHEARQGFPCVLVKARA